MLLAPAAAAAEPPPGQFAPDLVFVTVIGVAPDGRWCYLGATGQLHPIDHAAPSAPGHPNMSFTLAEASMIAMPPSLEGARVYVWLGSPRTGPPAIDRPRDQVLDDFREQVTLDRQIAHVDLGGRRREHPAVCGKPMLVVMQSFLRGVTPSTRVGGCPGVLTGRAFPRKRHSAHQATYRAVFRDCQTPFLWCGHPFGVGSSRGVT